MEFTAHNIELPDGTCTMAVDEPRFEDWGLCRAVVGAMLDAFDGEPRSQRRIADLGSLEGGYAVALARQGFEVLGIEGRATNFERCQLVADRLGLPNLRFAHDDVRNLADHGEFDATLCAGVLYHLDEPVRFLDLVARCTRRLLVLETHVASDQEPPGTHLGPWTTHEGRRGRWYTEWPDDAPPEAVESNRWASIRNSRSFWLERDALLDALRAVGFDRVTEPRIEGGQAQRLAAYSRVLLACTRTGASPD